jgi:hypothetical protein
MMRVLVCGGRDFDNRAMLNAALDRLHAERVFSLVIAGGARGADTLAEDWANARGIACDGASPAGAVDVLHGPGRRDSPKPADQRAEL